MKIEKINDNQIRCTLTREDLERRELKLSELAYGSEKAKSLFQDMMQQAAYEFGFEANNIPLMIEAIPVSSETIILIITKVEDPEELDTRFSKFSPFAEGEDTDSAASMPKLEGADEILDLFHKIKQVGKSLEKSSSSSKEKPDSSQIQLAKMYQFRDLDVLIRAAKALKGFYNGRNSIFKDDVNKDYFLVIFKSEHTPEEFNKVCNTLSEYGISCKFSSAAEAYFSEHYTLILGNTALQQLAAL